MFNTVAALCLIMCSTKNNLQAILYLNIENTEDEKDIDSYGLCVPMKTMAHLREHQYLMIFTHHYPGKRGTKGVQKTVPENRI